MTIDIPELFAPACNDLFSVKMDEERVFIARTWLSKTLPNTNLPSPACFLLSAERLSSANIVAHSIRSILDYVGIEASAGRLETNEVKAIIDIVTKRAKLLNPQEASLIFVDLGIPVNYSTNDKIEEVLVIPFTTSVGFQPAKIELLKPMVPNKC